MTQAESNKALVRRFYEEIDKGNIGVHEGDLPGAVQPATI